MLLEKLASNRKELQEAQALADAQPGSVSDYKLQELANQRRLLTEDLKATIHNIQEIQRHTLTGRSSEKQLHKLSEKEQTLLETLELKKKELQEAEVLAATQPGSISEHKLQELAEQKRRLTLDLEATVHDLQEIQHPGLQRALLRSPGERELYELSEKKQMLLKSLESKQKELEEAEALAATQPGSVSAHKLQELDKQRRRLAIDLEATVHGIQELQLRASQRAPTGRPAERDLYELSEKKQMLLRNLESKQEELEEAKALAAAEPGSIGEHKLQELDEQRRRLALDLEATVHDIQEVQHRASQRPLLGRPDERELSGLSEKKQILLESLESKKKELQEAEVLAATQPGSISEDKLQELAEQKRCLTLDLAATVHDIQEIQRRALLGSPGERELSELSDKKQKLLESLESKNKELQEAEALAATQPGSISAHKLQELDKQRRCLTVELEATVQEVQQRALSGRPAGKSLYELSEWKQVLLECLESNLKELEETHVLAAIQPDSISEKKIQELKDQRKILTENLKTVVQDVQKMKTHISESGGIIPFYRDLNELYKKKKRFLERLESNLKDLQAAEILAVAHPGSGNEQKVQELTEQRMLLAAGLDAIMQDLEDIVGLAKDKIGLRSRERNWEELSEKKKVFLENLASNLTALKQAQALAAAHQDDITEQKLQEIIEQRRLLTAGLQAIMQDMQQLQELVSSKLEKVEPSERELDELSEKRRLILENMEVNLEELKDLQAIVAQPSGMSEQKMQELTEKRELLVANFEAILQDMQDAQSFDLDQHVITRPDQRKINDLLELSRLESKLDDLEETGFFTDIQLDSLKRKVHKLKQQRRNLIDKWELLLLEDYPETYGLDKKAKQKVAKKILDERKNLFSYLQSSIKDLQRKSIQPITSSDTVRGVSDDSLIMGSLGLLQLKVAALSAKYGPDDEKTAKRRALAAKLEANIRDLQAAFEVEKIEKPRYAATKDASQARHIRKSSITELSDQQYLKPSFSGLQMQITKAPVIRKIKPDQTSAGHRKTEVEFDASVEEQQEKKLRREIEQVFKKHVLQQLPGSYYQQLPGSKTSSSMLPSALPYELNSDKIASDVAMQEILEYNKSLLPSHRANLQQALQLAQHQLQQQQQQQQQQSNALSERLRKMSVFFPQPPGTTRFHEYSTQPPRPAWEANQLPQKDYAQKLYLLKRKLLGPDMKGLGGAPFSSTQGPSSLAGQDQDTIVICGKGCNPFKKPGSFQAINEQLRHQ
ncbi:myosin heavy chain, striated muscle-like isoform X2 [Elgaria multicarinata webbii]|uniref:myosin heavy chain, striated muscle-like isoform X2 n=1 Tax=Elgaria multicarinata webbii TaxID=159646 RepID=UPI002FCD5926